MMNISQKNMGGAQTEKRVNIKTKNDGNKSKQNRPMCPHRIKYTHP